MVNTLRTDHVDWTFPHQGTTTITITVVVEEVSEATVVVEEILAETAVDVVAVLAEEVDSVAEKDPLLLPVPHKEHRLSLKEPKRLLIKSLVLNTFSKCLSLLLLHSFFSFSLPISSFFFLI